MLLEIVIGVVAFALFVLGVAVGLKLPRKITPVVTTIFAVGRFRITRSDGVNVYVGNDKIAARNAYDTAPLSKGESVEFFDNETWRGTRRVA